MQAKVEGGFIVYRGKEEGGTKVVLFVCLLLCVVHWERVEAFGRWKRMLIYFLPQYTIHNTQYTIHSTQYTLRIPFAVDNCFFVCFGQPTQSICLYCTDGGSFGGVPMYVCMYKVTPMAVHSFLF